MIRSSKIIVLLLLAAFLTEAAAQDNQVMYHMNLPQNHLLNPALRPGNSIYVGLPGLTGINLNINNNFFGFSDILMKGRQPSDSIISFLHPDFDVDKFLAKIKDRNYLEPQVGVQLLGLGFTAGNDLWVFLDIIERIAGNVVIPGDLLRLGLKGNEQFVGRQIDLSSLRGDVRAYHEIGLGFSKDITSRLRIGIKGKLLFGVASASISNNSLGITVNEDYSHTIDADLALNISGPVDVYTSQENNIDSIRIGEDRFDSSDKIFNFIRSTRNPGLAVDIGAEYKITNQLVVSASVTDLGYIKWKNDITNLRAGSQFEFSGLNMLDVYNGTKTFGELGEDVLDSLKNSLIITDTSTPYTTNLPVGVTLGGKYSITKDFSVGLLSYSRIIGRQFREALTLSANLNIGNALSTSLSYTAANSRFNNFGAGVAFRAGIFQFYMVADRIPLVWNKLIMDEGSLVLPEYWNTLHTKFGMNLVFGNTINRKRDRPMVLVE